jgi:hypothetical protein
MGGGASGVLLVSGPHCPWEGVVGVCVLGVAPCEGSGCWLLPVGAVV